MMKSSFGDRWNRMRQKYPRLVRMIALCFFALSFLINPFTIQQTLVSDGNLQSLNKIHVIYFSECVLFFVGIYIYLKSKKLWKKEILMRIFMCVSFLIACGIFLERSSFYLGAIFLGKDYFKPAHGLIMKNVWTVDSDIDVGYVSKKNNTQHAVEAYPNGKTIFDVIYSTDEYRRRTVHQTYLSENKHVILFGDSFTYGVGLNDEDTLQYHLQQTMHQYNIYNYAVGGYGPQQMLALLESKRIPQEVYSRLGSAVFIFAGPNNIRRLIGSTDVPWGYEFPYYTLDKNQEIIRKGNFFSDKTPLTYTYSLYTDLRNKSAFLQLLNLNFPIRIRNRDILLMYKLIERSKKLYEEQFDGTFYVLIHPLTEYNNDVIKLIRLLVDHHIPVLQYPLDPTSNDYRIIGDGHPNGKTNQLLSTYMAPILSSNIKNFQ